MPIYPRVGTDEGNRNPYRPVVEGRRVQRFEGYGDPGHDLTGSDFELNDNGEHDPKSEWRDPLDTATVNIPVEQYAPRIEPTPVVIVADVSEHAHQIKQWRTFTVALTGDGTGVNKPVLLISKDPQRTALRIKSRTGNTKDFIIGSDQTVSVSNGWAMTGGSGYVELTTVDSVWAIPVFSVSDVVTIYVDVLVEYMVTV